MVSVSPTIFAEFCAVAHEFFLCLECPARKIIRVFGAFFLHINKLMRIWNGNTTMSVLGVTLSDFC